MTGDALVGLALAPRVGCLGGGWAGGLPVGGGLVGGRGGCGGCGGAWRGHELLPLLSYLWQRGRCRRCGAAVGWLEPAAEAGAVAVAVSLAAVAPPSLLWPGGLLGWCLLVLALADLRHRRLPDALTLPLAAAGLALAAAEGGAAVTDSALGAVGGLALLGLPALVYGQVRGRAGLGGGDIKLAIAAGAWLGWQALPALLLGASLAGIGAILWRRWRHGVAMGEAMAFGPALAAACWGLWLAAAAGTGPCAAAATSTR